MKATPAQHRALAEIDAAGPDGLQFYTFSQVMRRKLVAFGWVEGEGRGFDFTRWKLTGEGRKALENGQR